MKKNYNNGEMGGIVSLVIGIALCYFCGTIRLAQLNSPLFGDGPCCWRKNLRQDDLGSAQVCPPVYHRIPDRF